MAAFLSLYAAALYVTGSAAVARCPINANFSSHCTCDPWQLKCTHLGEFERFPDLFVPDGSRIFSNVTVSYSRIAALREGDISALRTRELFLCGLGIRSIEDAVFKDQGDTLEALYLSDNKILTIAPGAFSSLSVLIRLKLDNNLLTAISEDMFAGLKTLKHLYLHGNDITLVDSRAFPGGLETLTLYRNKLDALPGDVFRMKNLSLLNLRENRFRNLSDELFRDLPSLGYLDLSWNNITLVGKGLFSRCPNLRRLDLAINEIVAVHPEAFSRLTELRFLDVSTNRLEELPGPLFANLSKLQALLLSGNRLDELPADMSRGIGNLVTLHLHGNRLAAIRRTPLNNLVLLEELTLDHNDIGQIEFGAFDNLGALRRIDLSHNRLESLYDDPFQSSADLEWLDVSHNRLGELPASYFRTLSRVLFIDLSENHIRTLSTDSFADQTAMKYLNLTDNWIESIEAGTFRSNEDVTFLSLASNPLPTLRPGVFDGLSSLSTLFLNNTCMEELPNDVFRGAEATRYITMRDGRLNLIRNETFSSLSRLRHLDMSGNRIEFIESGALAAPNITAISLARNRLTNSGLRAATALLSYTVDYLDISDNRIATLTGITPRIFDEIRAVFFAGNPFTCDCASDTYWIRSLHSLQDFDAVGCSAPSGRMNEKVVCFEDDCENFTYSVYPFEASCSESRYVVNASTAENASAEAPPDVCDASRYVVPARTSTTTGQPDVGEDTSRIRITLRTEPLGDNEGVLLTWNVSNPGRAAISGFAISVRKSSAQEPAAFFVWEPDLASYRLLRLDGDAEYRVCVRVVPGTGEKLARGSDCSDLRTSSVQPPEVKFDMFIAIVVLAVVAVIVVVLIVVGACLRRQKKRTGPKPVGVKKPNSPAPPPSPQALAAPDVTLVGSQNDVGPARDRDKAGRTAAADAAAVIWMDDDEGVNCSGDVWVEAEVTRLSRSMSLAEQQKDKTTAGRVRRSNSTLAAAGHRVDSFKESGAGGERANREELGEQTMLSLNIFDDKSNTTRIGH